jgi:hypothetical protein
MTFPGKYLIVYQLPVTSPMALSPSPVKDYQQATYNPVQPTDHTVEDHNRDRDAQATGFVGRPSEVAWLHDLQTGSGLSSRCGPASSENQSGYLSPLSANYFLDDMPILAPDQSTASEQYRPSKHAATQLVESYFQNLHASFPLVGKPLFLDQFRLFYANPDAQPGRQWITILSLIFAIAARHSSLVKQQSKADLPYFKQAWELYTSDSAVSNHPSLQQVQIESLISLYLLLVGQINR